MKVLNSYPFDDGFYMPAEYDRHLGCFMIWPQRPGSWGKDASSARKAFCEVASVIARSEDVYMAVSKEEYDRARIMLKDSGRIHLIKAESDDAWARDSGATFVVDNKHNYWDNYLSWLHLYQKQLMLTYMMPVILFWKAVQFMLTERVR